MDHGPKNRLVIPSDRRKASHVHETVMSAVEEVGFPENACFAIRLALEEALANAIRHGNQLDPAKEVTVEYDASPEQVVITVCDEGTGFDPKKVPDPTLEENRDKPCGRGVMLIRAYMTDVRYNRRGNCVTMIKKRECELPT